ncbi:MAG: hypothetical protein MR960_10135 [Prevotella sp.]|nr:hypothetical protein [Prevotella sp.]
MKKYMNIAKLGLMLMMLVGGVSFANAQEENPEKVTVEPLRIAVGDEVEVTVNYESAVERSGFQMHVILPEGLSFVKQEGVDADDEPITFFIEKGTACLASHTVQIDNYYKDNEKDLFVVIDNSKIKSLKSPGSLFTFKVKADESLADASQIVLKDVKFNGGQYFDVNVDVTKGTSTGINEAKAEEADNAPVFNLGGQRASKNGKGILVKKGKKYVQTR